MQVGVVDAEESRFTHSTPARGYDIVREQGPVGPSEIHERYTEGVDDPRTKRTVRAYLAKITQYNLLEADGASRDREYTAIDRPSPTLAEQGN